VALLGASEVEAAVGIGVAVPGASGVAVPRPSGVEAAVGTDEANSCGRLGKLRPPWTGWGHVVTAGQGFDYDQFCARSCGLTALPLMCTLAHRVSNDTIDRLAQCAHPRHRVFQIHADSAGRMRGLHAPLSIA